MPPTLWHNCFFLLFALIACGSAVAVVVSGNIVRMACYLVVSLSAVAGLFFLAGAGFVGAAQLMVYVGGTMVLLVFGVMLTARGPLVAIRTASGQWVVAVVIGAALLAVLLEAAFSRTAWTGQPRQPAGAAAKGPAPLRFGTEPPAAPHLPAVEPTAGHRPSAAEQLGFGLLGVRVDKLQQGRPVLREGMSGYLLAFEIISVHLVVVLIGAAYLARAKRRVQRRSTAPAEVSTY